MNDLVDTTEMYLRTIYDLEEEGVVPLRARIAERLEQSGPTVSQTVARMERDGLLRVAGDRHLELTEKGVEEAKTAGRRLKALGLSFDLCYTSALANNGRLAPLTLIKTDKPPQTTQVLPEAVAKTMQGMLQQVIEAPRGVFRAQVPAYHVAGKSGTLNMVWTDDAGTKQTAARDVTVAG